MDLESCGVVRFDLKSLYKHQTRMAKTKSVYKFFIIDPRGLQFKTNS